MTQAYKKHLSALEAVQDKCNVLVFDESLADLARHSESFEDKGFAVHGCTSVEDALRYVERKKVEFALVDLSPAHRGLRVFQHLARYSPYAASVAITRLGDMAGHRKAFTMGAMECLDKPVSGAELDWVILKYLGRSTREAERPANRRGGGA